MDADPGQDKNISAVQKDVTARLSRAKDKWKADLLPGLENDRRPFTVGYTPSPWRSFRRGRCPARAHRA